jgi:hypothetical protein
MRRRRVLDGGVAVGVFVAAFLLAGSGERRAGADCVGAQLEVSSPTARPGDVVRIAGSYFGTECNDSGPPGGRAVLGAPQRGIVLAISAGGRDRPVAVVDADDRYAFSVDVAVPPSIGVGGGDVHATSTSAGAGLPVVVPFTVVGQPQPGPDAELVVATRSPPASTSAAQGAAWPWLVAGAAGGFAAALAGSAAVRRSSRDVGLLDPPDQVSGR